MCKAYDMLSEPQREMFDKLVGHVDHDNPSAWLVVVDALREHLKLKL